MSAILEQRLIALREQARSNLEIKLRRLPKHLFLGRRHPTLSDICNNTQACQLSPDIPAEYDLEYYLAYFNYFVLSGFSARKGGDEDERDLSRAIWALQLDRNHSFSHIHEAMVYNMLAMMIVYAMPVPNSVCDVGVTSTFRHIFRFAFDEAARHQEFNFREDFIALWQTLPFDLIKWTPSQKRHLKKATDKLRGAIPPIPFDIEEFWVVVDEQPKEEREKYAAAWAMRWLIHLEFKEAEAHKEQQALATDKEAQEHELMAGLDAMGFNEFEFLNDEEQFDSDLMKALMVEIDPDVQPLPPQEHPGWMDASKAISLIDGTLVDLGEMIGFMSTMDMSAKAPA
ncbi:hypothetical protein N0V90_012240 [Kalmusia sp. IMI 367209]|nr:hypothetical protein N0V90_012240 [Kalmusia sp. IMI 367209]